MTRLLEPHELAEQGPPEAVRLPLDLVDENPNNPRRTLVEVEALAANIHQFGLLQPVTVRRAGDRYQLLGGHRRRAAFLALSATFPLEPQWRTIPAVVRSADDDTARLMLISGQVHNRAWTPREEATILEVLAVDHSLIRIGEILHLSRNWVSKRLRTYNDSVLSGYVQTGRLVNAAAEELLLIEDVELRREYAERAVAEHWTPTQARAEVRKLKIDKMIRTLDRRVLELVDLLSSIEPSRIPPEAFKNLFVLEGMIVKIRERAREGQQPVFPSLQQAKAPRVRTGKPTKVRRTRLRIE